MLYALWFAIEKAENTESSSFALRAFFAQMSAAEKLLIFYVMIFTPRQKMLLHGDLLEEFLAIASSDDLLLYRPALIQSAVLARLTPKTNHKQQRETCDGQVRVIRHLVAEL